ncbi:DUF4397 domain-containing protein [Chitinophaga sancti]|uniref:DUF4397 domain-containing protein n=1 Tax=Chitinophaga sancti TaxID=1004 RepID=A0A1K1RQW9_9BACT|nr:DUF4397 domain-containing protein [Chitinophaga sancti]WQD62509.1 DUF4397 domain-containing protein [Chitinophaga sancti]WQG91922.1 DUF4397 domain-containing protein [Chitinophaga sancti]SFW74229.1 protein of unknown function [Chitinophaga sancti]
MTMLNHASSRLLAAFALAGLVTFSSCSKDDNDTAIEPDATVKIVNVFPDAGNVNVYKGDSKINSSVIDYNTATAYLSVANGEATYDFKNALSGNTVLSLPVKFEGGNYSLFTTGKTSDNSATGILTKDNLDAPASGKAKIRFVHASTNLGAVNFFVSDSLLFNNNAYKSVSEFKEMAAGTYTLKLSDATSGTAVVTKSDVVLTAGKIYTVAAIGLVGNNVLTEQPLSVSVMENK